MPEPEHLPSDLEPDAAKEAIQMDIDQTRDELAETVGALSAKLDVKAQARHKADATKARVAETAHSARSKAAQIPPSVLAVAAVAIVSVIVWRRRRR